MRFGGIVLALTLLLGACSSDPAPIEPPKTTTATPTPTVTAPTMPPQAREDSPEGAAAFVKHYIDVFNYAASTGDVEELSRLSSPDCQPCSKYATKFEEIYGAGNRISQRLWDLRDDTLQLTDDTQVMANLDVNEGDIKPYKFNFRLSREAPYRVLTITIVEQS